MRSKRYSTHMPELPEVETTRKKIEPLLLGRTLLALGHDAPHKYRDTHLAVGKTILALNRRGKYLILPLSADEHPAEKQKTDEPALNYELIVHLGMTGGFRLTPSKHTRVTFKTDQGELYFDDSRRFGKVLVVRAGQYASMPTLANMGPEPLSDDFDEAEFVKAAAQCGTVKTWLLSQKPVSGVGNIYADESLWLAQIHPAQTRLTPTEAQRLYVAIRQVMAAAVAAGGSTLSDNTYQQHDGVSGLFQLSHQVYAREGQPCYRCAVPIEKIVLGQRGTHFCPACQQLR